MEYLPSQIIEEILYCLPQRSLARFKTVSKQWKSCIDNYNFVDEYRNRNRGPSYLLRLHRISSTSPSSRELHVCGIGSNSYTKLRTIEVPICYQFMLPSSFGLVCLHSICNQSIAVFNPTTEELIPLPDFRERAILRVCNGARYNSLGFGYDPRSRKYKAVQMVHDSNSLSGLHSLRSCYVLTVKRSASSWKAIDMSPDCKWLVIEGLGHANCFDGKLCWEACSQIIMFDLSYDSIQVIPSPLNPDFTNNSRGRHLVELQGRLGFVQSAPAGASLLMDISALNYSERCISWDHIYRLDLGPCPSNANVRYFPLCILEDGILLMAQQTLYSYDLKEKSLNIYEGNGGVEKYSGRPAMYLTAVYTETLVLLN